MALSYLCRFSTIDFLHSSSPSMKGNGTLQYICKFVMLATAAMIGAAAASIPPQSQPQSTRKLAVENLSLHFDPNSRQMVIMKVGVAIENREGSEQEFETYECSSEEIVDLPFYPLKVSELNLLSEGLDL